MVLRGLRRAAKRKLIGFMQTDLDGHTLIEAGERDMPESDYP